MIKPVVVQKDEKVTTVGKIFNTPLVVKGNTWLPIAQLTAFPIFAWIAKKRHPKRSWTKSLGICLVTMPVVLGSEWCHNLAHAAAARIVGKPMDAIRITWGMPLVVYFDINDPQVTPRQHIVRALGGPLFNLFVLPFALFWKYRTAPGSAAREIANAAVGTNAFLPAVGLLPIPGIDGGAILKWSLVGKDKTPHEADLQVRKVDGVLGVILAVVGVLSLKKRRWLIGIFLVLLAIISLAIALGILKEQE